MFSGLSPPPGKRSKVKPPPPFIKFLTTPLKTLSLSAVNLINFSKYPLLYASLDFYYFVYFSVNLFYYRSIPYYLSIYTLSIYPFTIYLSIITLSIYLSILSKLAGVLLTTSTQLIIDSNKTSLQDYILIFHLSQFFY